MPPRKQVRNNRARSEGVESTNENVNQERNENARARVVRGEAVGFRTRANISDFLKLDPPKFFGNEDANRAENWVRRMEQSLEAYGCDDRSKVRLTVYLLKDDAYDWWESAKALVEEQQGVITWENFKKTFLEEYFPKADRDAKATEFLELKQGSMSVTEYAKKFSTLIRHVSWIARNMEEKMHRFLVGLKPEIYDRVVANRSRTYAELLDRAKLAERGYAAVSRATSSAVSNPGKRPATAIKRTIVKRVKVPSTQYTSTKGNCYVCGGNHQTSNCYRVIGACFRCGKTDHMPRDCPQPKTQANQVGQSGQNGKNVRVIRRPVQNKSTVGGQTQQKPPARVYALTEEQADDAGDEVITDPGQDQ